MEDLREKYEVVIGLEVHAQLKTKSKIFAPDSTEFGNEQNSPSNPSSRIPIPKQKHHPKSDGVLLVFALLKRSGDFDGSNSAIN